MHASGKIHDIRPVDHDILHIVEKTITTHHMLQRDDSVLVGVSGGPDSLALLHILILLSSKLSIRLGVAHLNHCLRQADSDQDAAFVVSLSERLGLPCFMDKIDVMAIHRKKNHSMEDTARKVRYAFFQRIADEYGFNKIATGHHQEDNAEVMLMDIIRGCGSKGLSGIPPVRDGKIVRPLIEVSKSQIYDFLNHEGLSYKTDASNEDMRYLRNSVRHRLIPILRSSYNPHIVETLNRLSVIVRSEELWIDDIIEPIFNHAVLSEIGKKEISLSATAVHMQHIAVQRRMIRKALFRVKGDLKRIRLSHVESITRLLTKRPPYGCLDLPDRIRATLAGDRIVFSKEKESLRKIKPNQNIKRPAFSFELPMPGRLQLPHMNGSLVFSVIPLRKLPVPFPVGRQVVFIDMDKLRFPLIVRSIQTGDRFVPFGMIGSQKVNTFFINQKIPRAVRVTCPVVVNQGGRIVWVVGHRLDEAFRVTSSTRNVLKGELFLAY